MTRICQKNGLSRSQYYFNVHTEMYWFLQGGETTTSTVYMHGFYVCIGNVLFVTKVGKLLRLSLTSLKKCHDKKYIIMFLFSLLLALAVFLVWKTDALLQCRIFPLSSSKTSSSRLFVSRATFLQEVANVGAAAVLSGVSLPSTTTTTTPSNSNKRLHLSDEEMKQILLSDVVDRSFLVTAELTRDIYDESATFTDEIDTYSLPQWVAGTKKLFVAEGSKVQLVGDVHVTPEQAEFRFEEDLMFRIPFRPVVSLSGTVVLTRDPKTGLIISYKENWDQDVASVLKTAKFN